MAPKALKRPAASHIKVSRSVKKPAAKAKAALYKPGKVDRTLIKKATAMTKEEWQRHQEGMDEKWPLPAYMNGEKGHTQYKDETYEIITRWTSDTQIEYRPHAKSPGSKSHLRYEEYSKATTVGQALELGSYPGDWCWDFERGFIRVLGGAIRDEPLDIEKTDDSEATEVDRIISRWHAKELAKMLGMKTSELTTSCGTGESVYVRAKRLLAQREACQRLEAADKEGRAITDEEVLLTLQRWPFARNVTRKNVTPEGKDWVFSDSVGVLRDRAGDVHLTCSTRRYPQVTELFNRWFKDRVPPDAKTFAWTTINVNCNYNAALHRDAGNFGPSMIRAFGDFEGGELNYWPDDSGSGDLQALPLDQKVVLDLRKGIALFNGNCAHSVNAFTGLCRYSLVFFTVGCHAKIKDEDREKLRRLQFTLPHPSADPYTLLRPPKGYLVKAAAKKTPEKSDLPPFKFYPDTSTPVTSRKPLTAAQAQRVAATRLKPENAKTFYGVKRKAEEDEGSLVE